MKAQNLGIGLLTGVALFALAPAAQAQGVESTAAADATGASATETADTSGEIVVTAQKRSRRSCRWTSVAGSTGGFSAWGSSVAGTTGSLWGCEGSWSMRYRQSLAARADCASGWRWAAGRVAQRPSGCVNCQTGGGSYTSGS